MDKTKVLAAIDAAFAAHVTLLFGVLCADSGGNETGQAEARKRFNLGMANAMVAYDDAVADVAKLFA